MSIIYSFFLVCPSECEWHVFRISIKIQKKQQKKTRENGRKKEIKFKNATNNPCILTII